MPNRVEKCPLCNFEVALSSNHPHSYACPNVHRPFSQWLTTDSGYPVYPHPDDNPIDLSSTLLATDNDTPSPTDEDNPDSGGSDDTSTPDTPAPDFGGSDDGFAGGGGGSDW